MNNPIIYGAPPYKLALVHGGPGGSGSMTPVSVNLSEYYGVIEPLQTSKTIERQIQELYSIIVKYSNPPVILIGHSWGAWLSFIFTSRYPSEVKKLILISSAPFEEKYASGISAKRFSRFNNKQKEEIAKLEKKLLKIQDPEEKKSLFKQFGKLMSRADSYDVIPANDDETEYQPDIFFSIWNEAVQLRISGELLNAGHKICCPVIAIHGDYDTHPVEGVTVPLSKTLKDFKFILLNKCGHTPWYEKYAKDTFFGILKEEINRK